MPDDFQDFENKTDLERLLAESQVEDARFEFKDSRALTRDKDAFEEMCRDVTAFANAGGGQVIYGITEDKNAKKFIVDKGVEDPVITREWIDQKLTSNVNPPMQVRISEFYISEKGRAFVLTIPATINGPHQSPDRKYYRRSETHRPAMTDREIRDVIGRSTTAAPSIKLTLPRGPKIDLKPQPGLETRREIPSTQIPLIATISNRSPQPLQYAVFQLGLDEHWKVVTPGTWQHLSTGPDEDGEVFRWFTIRQSIATDLPIFRELDTEVGSVRLMFHIENIDGSELYRARVRIFAPGFTSNEQWEFTTRQRFLTARGPMKPTILPKK